MALDQTQYNNAIALSQAYPLIPWQVFYIWASHEGAPGEYNNNPLNIAYALDPNLTAYGEQNIGLAANTAYFPSLQQGASATAALLGENQYSGIRAGILEYLHTGNVQSLLQAIQNSPWASSHYGYSWLENDFLKTFGTYDIGVTGTIGSSVQQADIHFGPITIPTPNITALPIVGPLTGAVGAAIDAAFGGAASNAVGGIGNAIGNTAGGVAQSVLHAIVNVLAAVWANVHKYLLMILVAILGIIIIKALLDAPE